MAPGHARDVVDHGRQQRGREHAARDASLPSGWRDLASGLNAITHDIGGSIDDYVVDIQLRDTSGEAGVGVSTLNFGFDTSSTSGGATVNTGASMYSLTSTSVILIRAADDTATDQARVRIWVVPSPDYDSGWHAVTAGADLPLYHYIGGPTDDYVVDLTFKGGSPFVTVHNGGYGGDGYWDSSVEARGAYWHSLNPSSITVHRNLEDESCQQVRVRIFVNDSPDYDSGWQSLPASNHLVREHGLGGPWNDLNVDVQFRDTSDGFGVNQRGYGGDTVSSPPGTDYYYGAYWHHLTGSMIRVWRFADDIAADQVRVRVWEDRAPKYDSGWTDSGTSSESTKVDHVLDGDPDMYIVDLTFRDTNPLPQSSAGTNIRNYGIDRYLDPFIPQVLEKGAFWYELTSALIKLIRAANDTAADQLRVRMWHAPMPEYDSGWSVISQGQVLPLEFPEALSDNANDYVVSLDLRTDSGATHQVYLGGDTDEYSIIRGAYWRAFTTTSIEVVRGHDIAADEIRLRIWKNTAFDYDSDWDSIPGPIIPFGLGVPADELVVDLQMDSDDSNYGRNQFRLGGDQFHSGGALHITGAWWQGLTSSSLTVIRGPEHIHADALRVRLWQAPTGSPSFTLGVSLAGDGSGTVISFPHGIDCLDDCSELFLLNTTVTFLAFADSSIFTGWSGDADCTDGTVTMSADVSCTATFVPITHSLTVTKTGTGAGTVISSPAGINCGMDCSQPYESGTWVTLTATPTFGSAFTGWSGDTDCSDGQVIMSGARSCTATFELASFADGFESGDTSAWSGNVGGQ